MTLVNKRVIIENVESFFVKIKFIFFGSNSVDLKHKEIIEKNIF